jgi:hypothetical protein
LELSDWAANAQTAFEAAFVDAVSKKSPMEKISSGQYQVQSTLVHVNDIKPDMDQVVQDAKRFGEGLHKHIMNGNKGMSIRTQYVEATVLVLLVEEPVPKRQKT